MNTTLHQPKDGLSDTAGHPFWPTHVLDQVMIVYLLSGILLALAILLPFGLHGEADPLLTPDAIKPAWYFLAVYQLLKYVPHALGLGIVGTFFVVMIAWPLLVSAVERKQPGAAWPKALGVSVMGLFVLLTALGRISNTTVKVGAQTVAFDNLGLPHFGAGQEAE